MSKTFFGFPEDLYIGIIYFPPGNSTREKKTGLDHFQALQETTKKIGSDHIILMGDFNARTKNLQDTLTSEKNEEDLDQAGFFSKIETHRANQDQTINPYGRMLTEYCIATQSFIANGRTIGDLKGKYTCHEHNGSSTVDYAVINETLTDRVQSFQVLDPDTGSDHSAIRLNITLHNKPMKENTGTQLPPKIIWNDITKFNFTNKINSPDTLNKVIELQNMLDLDDDTTDEVLQVLALLNVPHISNLVFSTYTGYMDAYCVNTDSISCKVFFPASFLILARLQH